MANINKIKVGTTSYDIEDSVARAAAQSALDKTETDPVFSSSPASGITSANITSWNNKGTYSKPSAGIPKTDLASDVQTSLGKADTALQSFTEADPVFAASVAASISSSDISNWNNKTTVTSSTVETWGFKKISAGTTQPPSLADGEIYLVYEE